MSRLLSEQWHSYRKFHFTKLGLEKICNF
uniref:Uncharacterized protein n=1 Tax=Arundo donax TaxID=35708 RepID=A0A0A9BA72_ARUDO